MKKLLVKIKVIDQPYSASIPAQPEKWAKDDVEVYSQPQIEIDGVMVNDESYTYHPAIDEVPEQSEISHIEVIAQTQGNDEQLAEWLAGDSFKYPEGYWVDYIDITAEVAQQKINTEALAYLEATDWMVVREVETQVHCPLEIKQLRAEARTKIVR